MDDIRHKLVTKPTRFLDKLRLHIRQQGLAYTTEKTYIHWVKRFIYFHNKKHPDNLGIVDVEAFLSHLAVNQFCSLSTQKIALNALVYLYKRFMDVDIADLSFLPVKAPRRLPVVYSQQEITDILSFLSWIPRLMVELMYGTGLRSAELLLAILCCMALRRSPRVSSLNLFTEPLWLSILISAKLLSSLLRLRVFPCNIACFPVKKVD